MSTEYPGIPTVTKRYWQTYMTAAIGLGISYTFLGSLAGIITLTLLPGASWLFVFALGTFILHTAALFVKDVREGDFDPSQSTFSSKAEYLAMTILWGSVETTLLLVGTVAGYALITLGGAPFALGVLVAAYYPVVDIVLMRRGWYTVGAVVAIIVVAAIDMVVDIHRSWITSLPVIGTRRRPQS